MCKRPRRKQSTRREHESAIVDAHRWKLSLLRAFIARHGWSKLVRTTVVPPGVRLFSWVATRRQDYRDDRIAGWLAAECEAIPGWSWSPLVDALRRNLDRLRTFVKQHGWDAVKGPLVVDGVQLGKWLAHRRAEHERGTLARWLVTGLERIPGWTWEPRRARQARNLKLLRGHVARFGWASIDEDTVSRDGVKIGQWLANTRAVYRSGALPAWLAAGLESIAGWSAEPRRSRQRTRVARLARFVATHGWDNVTEALIVRGDALGTWVSYCRARYREKILPAETIAGLEAIPGWSWQARGRGPRPTTTRKRSSSRR